MMLYPRQWDKDVQQYCFSCFYWFLIELKSEIRIHFLHAQIAFPIIAYCIYRYIDIATRISITHWAQGRVALMNDQRTN